MNPDQLKRGFPWIIPATAVVLFAMYMATYYVLVVPYSFLPSWTPYPHYRYGQAFAEPFFMPANRVDKMIRPKTWAAPPRNTTRVNR
jgi:hypothetical protein